MTPADEKAASATDAPVASKPRRSVRFWNRPLTQFDLDPSFQKRFAIVAGSIFGACFFGGAIGITGCLSFILPLGALSWLVELGPIAAFMILLVKTCQRSTVVRFVRGIAAILMAMLGTGIALVCSQSRTSTPQPFLTFSSLLWLGWFCLPGYGILWIPQTIAWINRTADTYSSPSPERLASIIFAGFLLVVALAVGMGFSRTRSQAEFLRQFEASYWYPVLLGPCIVMSGFLVFGRFGRGGFLRLVGAAGLGILGTYVGFCLLPNVDFRERPSETLQVVLLVAFVGYGWFVLPLWLVLQGNDMLDFVRASHAAPTDRTDCRC